MTQRKLFDAIELISDKYIEEADPNNAAVRKNSASGAIRWIAAAAAVVILISAVSVAAIVVRPKGSAKFDSASEDSAMATDGELPKMQLIDIFGAYYEVVSDPDILAERGLPAKVSPGDIGDHAAWLEYGISDHDGENCESTVETDTELLGYIPAQCDAVYILRDGGEYYFAVLCNYHTPPDKSMPMSDLLVAYGIADADDIIDVGGVSDRARIEAFYDALIALPGFSSDDFQREVFASDGSDNADIHTDFADDRREITITAATGLRLKLEYHPTFGWICGGASLSYYPLSDELREILGEMNIM